MDNATCHNAAYSIYHLVQQDVQIIFNASNSPALNLIELVFSDLKKELRKKNRKD